VVAEILAREKVQFTVWVSLAATFVNIVGNLVFVPRMGISGSALASSISYSLLSFLVTWYYLRETGVPWTALVPCRSDVTAYAVLLRRSVHSVSFLKGAPRGVQL
jgi:O-antigen/teichoic acid export membrane protein